MWIASVAHGNEKIARPWIKSIQIMFDLSTTYQAPKIYTNMAMNLWVP
jgi:hypothetical protein